jgi:hypothetical protein
MFFLQILLEWTNLFTSADDFKNIIGAVAGFFGLSKIWDVWRARNDNSTKVKEAEIKANAEKNNAIMLLKQQENTELKKKLKEYQKRNVELIIINEGKDKKINQLHERLIDCEKRKNP